MLAGAAAVGREGPAEAEGPREGGEEAEDGEDEGDEALRGFAFAALEKHDEGVLDARRPRYVIMYDPDIAFVRQLEVCTREPGPPHLLLLPPLLLLVLLLLRRTLALACSAHPGCCPWCSCGMSPACYISCCCCMFRPLPLLTLPLLLLLLLWLLLLCAGLSPHPACRQP